MLFTSVLQNVHCSLDEAHGRWQDVMLLGGLYHLHMAGDASLPTYFQFRLVFINNLHFLEAYLTRYLPYNLRWV